MISFVLVKRVRVVLWDIRFFDKSADEACPPRQPSGGERKWSANYSAFASNRPGQFEFARATLPLKSALNFARMSELTLR